ncbi:hypothetical protein ACFLT1_09855, partial [Bacteroidota bacterium]
MRKKILLLIILCSSLSMHGQLKTYLSLDAGPSWDIARADDASGLFSNAITFSSEAGIDLWQEIISNLYIGTGAYYHAYYGGINLKDSRPHQPSIPSYKALLFPARVAYKIRFPLEQFSLTPVLGYQYGRLWGTPEEMDLSSRISDPEGNDILYSLDDELPTFKVFGLIEAGVSADYLLKNNWQVSAYFSRIEGLQIMKNSVLDYQVNTNSPELAAYSQDGSRIHASIKLFVPVSNLWVNSKARKHRNIQNTSINNSRSRNINYLYLGGSVGPYWRSYVTSNPAIGPLPIQGKGIFRYANLFTGGYAGIMFTERFAIDIGAYLHRSSSNFSIMYDHIADPTVKNRAPFFLEFPLTFRFSYAIPEIDVYIVPGIGMSLLTHMAGPAYLSGNGTFEYQAS